MIFKNRKELEAVGYLRIHDNILFWDLEYRVNSDYLSCIGSSNGKIFDILSLDKEAFCTSSYGYGAYSGLWPAYKTFDYEAAYRVIIDLYKEYEKYII